MLALLLAVALTAAPRYDTIITRDGARLAGTVVEESPTKGVTVELPDGTLRRFDAGAVVRIEFADGSVSTWEPPKADAQQPAGALPPVAPPPSVTAPAPAPVAPPAPPPQPPAAAAQEQAPQRDAEGPLDTVYLVGGGRVRGRVIEFIPKEGLTLQVPDGTVRRYATDQIEKIQYGDGTVSRRKTYRPPPPPPRQPPPPAYGPPGYASPGYPPPQPPPPYAPVPRGMPPISPVWGSIGLGGAGFGGDLAGGVHTGDIVTGQLDIMLEGGVRLSRAIGLGLYLDVGVGDPASAVRAECAAIGSDCTASTVRFGGLLRHTWDPAGRTSPWIAFGAGWAQTGVTYTRAGSHSSSDYLKYTGWEPFRFMFGVDLRSNPVIGFGLYGGVSWATFSHYEDVVVGSYSIGDQRFHAMYEGGIRLTLFP